MIAMTHYPCVSRLCFWTWTGLIIQCSSWCWILVEVQRFFIPFITWNVLIKSFEWKETERKRTELSRFLLFLVRFLICMLRTSYPCEWKEEKHFVRISYCSLLLVVSKLPASIPCFLDLFLFLILTCLVYSCYIPRVCPEIKAVLHHLVIVLDRHNNVERYVSKKQVFVKRTLFVIFLMAVAYMT